MTAQAVTLTETRSGPLKKVVWDWLCTDAGAVSSQTSYPYSGEIIEAAFVPDGGGTQPTTGYDATILDADGLDVLNGLGADLGNAATVYKVQTDKLGAVASSKLTLTIANAGNAKGGVVHLFIR
jgi:hypothetical protein